MNIKMLPPFKKCIGIIVFFAFFGILLPLTMILLSHPGEWGWGYFTILFGGLSLYMFIDQYFDALIITDTTMTHKSLWSVKTIHFDEIKKVKVEMLRRDRSSCNIGWF